MVFVRSNPVPTDVVEYVELMFRCVFCLSVDGPGADGVRSCVLKHLRPSIGRAVRDNQDAVLVERPCIRVHGVIGSVERMASSYLPVPA